MIDPELIKRRAIGIALLIAFIILALATTAQTKSEVYDYIIASDIKHPKIVYAQVLKETGHLKCTKCSLRVNNLFGFWDGEKYLRFDTWERSIDYYERWQIRKGYGGGDYYLFLQNEWGAPDMLKYIRTLKQIKIDLPQR